MDKEIRTQEVLAKATAQDDPIAFDRLRISQWRAGQNLDQALPGDLVEIEGYSDRTRGILLSKAPSNNYRLNCWVIKRPKFIARYRTSYSKKSFSLKIIEPRMPGVVPPESSRKLPNLIQSATLIDLRKPPTAFFHYGTESIRLPIVYCDIALKKLFSVRKAFEMCRNDLCLDIVRQLTYKVNDRATVVGARVIPPQLLVEEGLHYFASVVHYAKG